MAFVTEAALIALREGLEALLITGILLGLVTRLGRPDARRHVWAGFGAAVLASLAAGWLIYEHLFATFEQQGWGAWFELSAVLLAVATLTYMVFWMWSHTTRVLSQAKDEVRQALTAGSLATIVAITFLSVVREGLETVLFYATLATEHAMADILVSGVVGFAASAGLVYLVLRASRHVNLERFFQVTGAFLLVVAAMLLTHAVEALTELGYLAPQAALWDTSHLIAGGSVLGRILHATVGYTPAPTLYQALAYLGYLAIAGGAFLQQQGFFHRATTTGDRPRTGRIASVAIVALLVAGLVGVAAQDPVEDAGLTAEGHDHGPSLAGDHHADGDELAPVALPGDTKVGVMLRAHGEPLAYNATTYESFADFTRNLLEMLGYEGLLAIDQGTVLVDREQPYAHEPRLDPALMDAWLEDRELPAAYVGSPVPDREQVPVMDGLYVAPGGPGLGEPDVLEAAGLTVWADYLQMENASQMHPAKQAVLDDVEHGLEERFGDQVVVERAHHIKPMVDPDAEDLSASTQRLVDADVDVIVDAYTSHLHSDVMNECMMKPAFHEALDAHGWEGEVLEAGPSGLTDTFAHGLAEAIAEEIDEQQTPDEQPWLSLTHHGADPDAESPCREGPEPYVEQTHAMFENTRRHLEPLMPANTTIVMAYGQGAEDTDEVYSPLQAAENASATGAQALVDVPYELPGDGYDNLVNHRASYDLDPRRAPHYDEGYDTHLTRHGIDITITSSAFGAETRAQAQLATILDALAATTTTEDDPR